MKQHRTDVLSEEELVLSDTEFDTSPNWPAISSEMWKARETGVTRDLHTAEDRLGTDTIRLQGLKAVLLVSNERLVCRDRLLFILRCPAGSGTSLRQAGFDRFAYGGASKGNPPQANVYLSLTYNA